MGRKLNGRTYDEFPTRVRSSVDSSRDRLAAIASIRETEGPAVINRESLERRVLVEANVRALQTREPNSPVLKRYAEVAQLLTGRSIAGASDAIGWLHQLCVDLDVAPDRLDASIEPCSGANQVD